MWEDRHALLRIPCVRNDQALTALGLNCTPIVGLKLRLRERNGELLSEYLSR